MDQARVYLGVDPGKNGGAALLDAGGGIVEVWRWRESKDPLSSYNILLKYAGYKSIYSYIEHIRIFPALPPAVMLNTQALLVNVGQWHAILALLRIPTSRSPRPIGRPATASATGASARPGWTHSPIRRR